MSDLNVACVVEGDYVPHTAAMLDSVLANRGDGTVHVYYLHGPELPRRSLRTLERWLEESGAQVSLLCVPDEWCEGLPTKGFTGKATWYRIFLPTLLAREERVLFLDADLVVRDSLEPLWETDLSNAYLAAVSNVFEPEYLHRPGELGLDGPEVYFNAGVMLMNLELMRAEDCATRLHDYGVAHAAELVWRDQDALNVILGDRRRPLHPRWNFMNSMRFPQSREVFGEAMEEARARPGIRHFEGPADNKPWHYGCERDDREIYFEHRRRTPWPKYRLEGAPSLPRRVARAGLRRLPRP